MKIIKEAASLIIAANLKNINNTNILNCDYNLLCMKRNMKSSFMPNSYVFPGGMIEEADASIKWNNLFSRFGLNIDKCRILPSNRNNKPKILDSKPNELSRDISLRITAIRETFEESGILICKHVNSKQNLPNWAHYLEISDEELNYWQKEVHNDASKFYTLCEYFKCYPDICALHEWSNWLTPAHQSKRFDSIFYLTCLPSKPHYKFDEIEMTELVWDTPDAILSRAKGKEILLPVPQHYEIARIIKFKYLKDLCKFAVNRGKNGISLMLGVKIKLSDGNIYVLPGDTMFPQNLDIYDDYVIDRSNMTMDQFNKITPVLHRMEFTKFDTRKLIVDNFNGLDGHLTPIISELPI